MLLNQRLREITGSRVVSAGALGGSSVARVSRILLEDGRDLVLKQPLNGELHLEGQMLEWLAKNTDLPVPKVHFQAPDLLLMDYIAPQNVRDRKAMEEDAALHLFRLHSLRKDSYGFEFDTLIGSLPQPNSWQEDWVDFYLQNRLMPMADLALERGNLSPSCVERISRLEPVLRKEIGGGNPPGLIHGDVWGGNVLPAADSVAAFIDPALSYSDPEVELAFLTMFHTFSDHFFEVYSHHTRIEDGFFERRVELYLIYPYLVHTAIFGGPWAHGVEARLDKLGI